jgi:hypothetical protein
MNHPLLKRRAHRFTRLGMFTVRRWDSQDGRFAIEESRHDSDLPKPQRLATVFRLLSRDELGHYTDIVSRHRKLSGAIRALERRDR